MGMTPWPSYDGGLTLRQGATVPAASSGDGNRPPLFVPRQRFPVGLRVDLDAHEMLNMGGAHYHVENVFLCQMDSRAEVFLS